MNVTCQRCLDACTHDYAPCPLCPPCAHEEPPADGTWVPLADVHRLDSWLSALRHGRVIPGAYRNMSEEDQFELDALYRLVRSWTK